MLDLMERLQITLELNLQNQHQYLYNMERFFKKSSEEATQIMMHVHQKGVGVCGVFTYEVAETKVQQVMDLARQHQHPLQCTLEKA